MDRDYGGLGVGSGPGEVYGVEWRLLRVGDEEKGEKGEEQKEEGKKREFQFLLLEKIWFWF